MWKHKQHNFCHNWGLLLLLFSLFLWILKPFAASTQSKREPRKSNPPGISLLWVKDTSSWIHGSVRVAAGPRRHSYYAFSRSGRVQEEPLLLYWKTWHRWTVGAPQTTTGMLRCPNLCFQNYGSVNLRIWCKMWSGPKGKWRSGLDGRESRCALLRCYTILVQWI